MVEQLDEARAISPEQWQGWLNEIKAIGGTNPLNNFEFDAYAHIDLERAHPVGQAQFFMERPTFLSNLIRDAGSFSGTLAAARNIKEKADRLSQHFGIDSIHVAGGLVELQADGVDLQLPIMLWPVMLIARGADDFELTLQKQPTVNPALVDALAQHYGIQLNAAELLHRQALATDLVPADLLSYLNTLLANRTRAVVSRRLMLGNFTTLLTELVRDFASTETAVLRVLAGVDVAKQDALPLPEAILVADADAVQKRIVSRVLAGDNFAVETLPGTGYTQTVLNSLAALVNAGKRVLLVAPRRQTLNELNDRIASVGLNGLAVRSTDAWIDSIAAISRNEKATGSDGQASASRGVQLEELEASAAAIDAYFETLNSKNEKLGVSVAEALSKLSELSGMPHAPVTNARLDREQLVALSDRTEALELLQQAHDLGEFRFGPDDTAWFQAQFENAEQVTQATALAARLRDEAFPKLSAQLADFTKSVNFAPAVSVEDWGRYLRLFVGIRETLDRFQNVVFDRPLTELIIATGPRKPESNSFADDESAPKMSGVNRRRLKKLAKEYLRPGMTVTDMHSSLRSIAQQREEWQRFCTIPTPPQVPLGIADAQVAYQSFVSDLERLQAHLDPESADQTLVKLPLDVLAKKLDSLASDTDSLARLGDRLLVTDRLRSLGLGQLIRDLARIKVSREHLAQELEQAWWQSALEYLVAKNPKLLSYSSTEIARLEEDFRVKDAALVATGAPVLAAELAKRWQAAIAASPEQAANLKNLLRSGRASMSELAATAPAIWPVLAPAVLVSPFELPHHIGNNQHFDVLFVLDAAGTTVAENLAALRRSRQVVVWGDDAIAGPDGFELIPASSTTGLPTARAIEARSMYAAVRDAFGLETMRHSWRTTGQTLGALINREFYQNRIVFEPTAAEFMSEPTIQLSLVQSGNRAADHGDGATESLDAEVARVVELVIHHAKWHPQDSLLVATASYRHASRIREAVQAALAHTAELATFFEGHGRERFEVSSIADLTHRTADRVIFSIGFGLTQHGALLSNFGQLQSAKGRRYLANLLVSSRREITVVSCFDAAAMERDNLQNGSLLLHDLLAAANKPSAELVEFDRDPMLVDLGLRLQKLGVRANGAFAERLPLVCGYAKTAVVIEPDWALRGDSYTEKMRLRPALLTAMGWRYVRVHSFELFADPQAVANRIAESMGVVVRRAAITDRRDETAFEDTDLAWGDARSPEAAGSGNDRRLRDDKPPHWG